jgi:hypothetical protein
MGHEDRAWSGAADPLNANGLTHRKQSQTTANHGKPWQSHSELPAAALQAKSGMLWRILTVVVVLFWALMTGLLLRDTYFPDASRFAEVPPKYVFDLFLKEAASFHNTLNLYHEKEKIGDANFQVRREADVAGQPPVYTVMVTGSVQPKSSPHDKRVTWRLSGELFNGVRWRSLQVHSNMPLQRLTADIAWKEGDALPNVEVRRGSSVVLDSQMLQAMMALQSGGGGGDFSWLAQAGKSGTADQISGMQLRAREGVIDLAGRQRKCYIIQLTFMGSYEIRAFFTEVGELARVDLPEGYQLLEPLMHGLEAGLNNVDE